jgi:glycosyltransferase involved in cell wall biosynthesis
MESVNRQSKGLVSVIIPIRRGEDVYPVVRSVIPANSFYAKVEVIVVDEGLERSAQRNIGIDRATGEYLLILDSDQVAGAGLIGECVTKMDRDKSIGGIFIPETLMTKGFWGRVRNWERQFYTGTPVDCVRFVRAQGCPKFDVRMNGPEDSDWNHRVPGKRIVSHLRLYHHENMGTWKFLMKKAYYAKSMRRYKERWPNDKVLDWRWRCFGVFFENGKWKRFTSNPIYAAAVWFLILARGIVYKLNK